MAGIASKHLWEARLKVIGAHSWADKLASNAAAAAAVKNGSALDTDVTAHVTMYVVGTDAGPDEQGANRLVIESVAADLLIWIIWTYCFPHQCHLIAQRQLTRTV